MNNSLSKKHPKGLYLLFFVELWERFSYYGMRAILILYLTKSLLEGGLGIDFQKASSIYGLFISFVYFTPLIGGWLADRYLGKRHSIAIGGFIMTFGQLSLFFFQSIWGLYLGLLFLVIGNGFFKPNISTLVGELYLKDDPKKNSAFNIFYMGINIGAFISPLVAGYLAEDAFVTTSKDGLINYGYRYGFLASAIGMIIGQIIYFLFGNKYLGEIGKKPFGKENLNQNQDVKNIPLTKEEKDRTLVIFIFFLLTVFFWAAFEQTGSSLSLYTDQFINKKIFSWNVPTSWFQAINGFFIITLSPLFVLFWISKLGKKISIPISMAIGMIFLGLGYLFMVGSVIERENIGSLASKASMLWIVFTYFLHSVGELFISPVGLSIVSKLSPAKYISLMMGVILSSSFVGGLIAGQIAKLITSKFGNDPQSVKSIFMMLSIFPIFIGIILLFCSKWISKKMHGIK